MKKNATHVQDDTSLDKRDTPQEEAVVAESALAAVAEAALEEIGDHKNVSATDESSDSQEVSSQPELVDSKTQSEKDTAAEKKSIKKKKISISKQGVKKHWLRVAGVAAGSVAIILLVVSAFLSQYYKEKVMPGVVVAGEQVSAKNTAQLRGILEPKVSALSIVVHSGEKTLQPTLEELDVQVDIDATVQNILQAKRTQGLLTKLTFWKEWQEPVVVTVNKDRLTQYIETQLPDLHKPPVDAQLQFSPESNQFIVTSQADGEGVAVADLQQDILQSLQQLNPAEAAVQLEKKKPKITEAALQPLTEPANEILKRRIALSGGGYTFQATAAEIAAWITPTPQDDGTIKLVIDQSKVQAYVEAVGKRISQMPQDRKVLTTETGEVVLQAGRDGTELTDQEQLAKAITIAVEEKRDLTQQMNIQVAAFKTINMEAYDRWVEVDLSEQRTTLYSGTTPLHSFVISSGLPQWPTVTGEFKVWHKNATQTMTGGSRATGDYYNLPNVTWVTYFYKDYGFHTAYWHNNFGYPMSHGCVNMREADAKILYDFAPIGTTVIVHH